MLHGWSMHSGVWHQLAELLAKRFCLHLVDLPGHGLSNWETDQFKLSNILPELEQKTPAQAIWIGWSLGGLLSLAMQSQYPAKVDKLVLMAATPKFVSDEDWPCAMPAKIFEDFAENLNLDQRQTLQRFLMLQAKGAEQSRSTIRQLSEQLANQHMPHPEALKAGLDLLLSMDLRQALSKVSCPLQLILGDRDTLIPASMAEQAIHLNPAVQLEIIKGAGHAPFISQPQRCQQLIEQFIDG
jgi:pimeloyl-[acyl-carrier protein] methyl ester esterase